MWLVCSTYVVHCGRYFYAIAIKGVVVCIYKKKKIKKTTTTDRDDLGLSG